MHSEITGGVQRTCTVRLLVVSKVCCTLADGSFIMSSDIESRRLPVLAELLPNMDLKMTGTEKLYIQSDVIEKPYLENGCMKLLARPPVPTGDCRRAKPSPGWGG